MARDLLADSGSIFVQIGDENIHRVRAVLDEVFGEGNLVSQIAFRTTTGRAGELLAAASNYLLWYAKSQENCKYRPVFQDKAAGSSTEQVYSLVRNENGTSARLTPQQKRDPSMLPAGMRLFRPDNLTSSRPAGEGDVRRFTLQGRDYSPGKGTFKTDQSGLVRLSKADRLWPTSQGTVQYVRFFADFPVIPFSNVWTDTGTGSFTDEKIYVVQTNVKVIERCIQMTTDPGDLVLDPTCGSGTTVYVAEQWGRRWITIDTSRVALALARARIMGARYPYYMLADSPEGQLKEAEVTRTVPKSAPTRGDIRLGFVYERVPHITLKSIANNAEIDVIWEKWQATLEPLREALNAQSKKSWQEWEIPREADAKWPAKARQLHAEWWEARIARQKEIDASIAAKAEFEYLYDTPYDDKKRIRVAGPFTVESLSPHRVLAMDQNDTLVGVRQPKSEYDEKADFATVMLDHLKTSGVQQAHKEDRISFSSVAGWPGEYVCAEGRYMEGAKERRAGIFVGPEYGTVSRPDLVAAAREAADAGFDVLIACAFNFEAHAAEFEKLGRVPVLKARMNPDLHMADELKNTGAGNLFIVFGEPDIKIEPVGKDEIQVRVKGVDVFRPQTGEIESGGTETIALWMIDTDYNEESFFVRHAYFLGANDPYKALKTTLKAEIDEEAWATLNREVSRPFPKPKSGRIAVKVINHLGDEVMKVFAVA